MLHFICDAYFITSFSGEYVHNTKIPVFDILPSSRNPRLVLASHWTVPEGWAYCAGSAAWR